MQEEYWGQATSMWTQSRCHLRPPKPQEGIVKKARVQVKQLVTMTPGDCLIIEKLQLTPSDGTLTVAEYP